MDLDRHFTDPALSGIYPWTPIALLCHPSHLCRFLTFCLAPILVSSYTIGWLRHRWFEHSGLLWDGVWHCLGVEPYHGRRLGALAPLVASLDARLGAAPFFLFCLL